MRWLLGKKLRKLKVVTKGEANGRDRGGESVTQRSEVEEWEEEREEEEGVLECFAATFATGLATECCGSYLCEVASHCLRRRL